DVVLFKPLTLPQIERIVDLQMEELRRRLADRRIRLDLTENARRLIASHGFDPVYGARPLRRYISREVETTIGRSLLGGEVREGSRIRLDASDRELVVSYEDEHENSRV
ncbi:MAG TPA: type VI secretion system ATPase TssH, partial [Actinopolymorphaceae bacterium]